MDFLLLLLTTATLLLRPQDFVADLAAQPVYLVLLFLGALVACPAILQQLQGETLVRRPITVCVVGVLAAIVLSYLAQLSLWGARTSGGEFAKVLLFYLVVAGTLNTPGRLRFFLGWLAGCVLIVTVLALLEYHQAIELPQLSTLQQREIDEETGEESYTPRLQGIGLFGDPNDLCLILLVGIAIGLYRTTEPGAGIMRLPWLTCFAVFLYALALTQSRGGFLAFLVFLLVLFRSRYGWRKALGFVAVALPGLLLLFAGRQTEISTKASTGQDRIQLWSEGLQMFRSSPLFGIGQGLFQDEAGLVAHNSYLHCFAELGFLGGTCFLGAFVTAIWSLHRLGQSAVPIRDAELQRLLPYLTALVAAYAVGILWLSRAYIAPTYLILALATSYLVLAVNGRPAPLPRLELSYLGRLAGASAVFLAGMYVFVRLTIHRV